ncbi:hypothetical protein [Sporosarcina sp. YIM B06819]|uniref:hypothetical protein n=1 Tax=Sporosarcina sp. YIM B06819 TaxID=3081769 RepID=UPI00298C09AE|nr:hypothetical protein [Sporosarcina sp. YIM B06819]
MQEIASGADLQVEKAQESSISIEEMSIGIQRIAIFTDDQRFRKILWPYLTVQKIEEFSINSRDNTRVVAKASVSQLHAVHQISDEAQVLTDLSDELLDVVNTFVVKA